MSEPKPFASLSSGLLARKGAAKPAMRPQSFGPIGGIEDLGWNDMGYAPQPYGPHPEVEEEPREHVPSSIAALTPAPRSHEPEKAPEPETPAVVEQQRAIVASFSAEVEAPTPPHPVMPTRDMAPVSAPVVAMPRKPRQAPGSNGKAAFTLRLEPERHLKLRLACAIRHRSAQQIVSEALDEFLDGLPELASLAQQLPAKAAKRN